MPLLAAIALVGVTVLALGGGKPSEEGPYAELDALREASNEARLANGDEASREGPGTPAEEQVANRAYPRTYVDDRLARREHQAFSALPDRPLRGSFSSGTRYRQAVASTTPWTALGPTTPNVAGEASQFFDYETEEGPPTQESGRVTAIAIDPSCGSEALCRMWVAAAGGGIWRTEDAMATPVEWIEPAADLPTNAFGSLYYDAASEVLYAGSGEPNGSGDSEAGLGLFRSTDFGASWTQVPGSVAVATNRSIGAIAVDPTEPETIYIGTDVARHGSSSVNGGRFTPPSAPALGVYRSSDGGATFSLEVDLSNKTPASPNLSSSGVDWFQGGVNKLELDPNDHNALYAAVFGYGVWRANQSEPVAPNELSWERVFHTMNQNDFSDPEEPLGDTFGDRTEFDLVDVAEDGENGGPTRMYVGDASDDWATDENPATPLPEAWRNDDVAAIAGEPNSTAENEAQGWIQLSSSLNDGVHKGFAAYGYCQNGQCDYDSFVAHPPGAGPDTVWYGGAMNYDELPAYGGEPPRSNGRAVIRSTNGGEGTVATASTQVEWQDMTAVLKDPSKAWGVEAGIHPDLHAIAFANNGATAFIGSDGGVVRLTVGSTQDQSESCEEREYEYSEGVLAPLLPADLLDCEMLLGAVPSAIEPLNDGLNDLQFQSLSFDPQHPADSLLGGTQDNGTWGYEASLEPAEKQWEENVGGDGGQSGFDAGEPTIRYHNYYSSTPEVNFDGNDPNGWFDIYDRLLSSEERSSFYTPFVADPQLPGRAFTGLEHVWRTNDHGGSQASLEANGCSIVELDPSSHRALRRLEGNGRQPDQHLLRLLALRPVRGRDRAGAQRPRHAVGRDPHRSALRHQERRRDTGRVGVLLPDRHDLDAGALRLGDRRRPRRPQPGLDLLLRLRRLHPGHHRPRLRSPLRPRHPQRHLHRPLRQPRRPAGDRDRRRRHHLRPLRVHRLRGAEATGGLEHLDRLRDGPAERRGLWAEPVRQRPGALRGHPRAGRLRAVAARDGLMPDAAAGTAIANTGTAIAIAELHRGDEPAGAGVGARLPEAHLDGPKGAQDQGRRPGKRQRRRPHREARLRRRARAEPGSQAQRNVRGSPSLSPREEVPGQAVGHRPQRRSRPRLTQRPRQAEAPPSQRAPPPPPSRVDGGSLQRRAIYRRIWPKDRPVRGLPLRSSSAGRFIAAYGPKIARCRRRASPVCPPHLQVGGQTGEAPSVEKGGRGNGRRLSPAGCAAGAPGRSRSSRPG